MPVGSARTVSEGAEEGKVFGLNVALLAMRRVRIGYMKEVWRPKIGRIYPRGERRGDKVAAKTEEGGEGSRERSPS